MRDFAQLGNKLRAACAEFPVRPTAGIAAITAAQRSPNINGMGAYEGGQLPGAINAATRIRTARAAVNDLSVETLAEFLGDTLTARFGKVKASLILRDALTGVEK